MKIRLSHWARILAAATCLALGQDATFHATVPAVLVPVSITDAKGHHIDGLSADDFALLDDGTPQRIRCDAPGVTTIPFAVVFVIQADDIAATAILKIRKVGSMVAPLVTGEGGQTAVLAYGSTLDLIQNFTAAPEFITRAFDAVKPQEGHKAPMLDAIANAVTILSQRPTNERRIIVTVGESRDRGSKTKFDDVVKLIERQSVTVFSFVYSAYLTPFTTKGTDMPPPGDTDLSAIFTEPARLGKRNAAAALAEYSGGRKLSFATLKGLEQGIGRAGEELHSQYLLSYTPSNRRPGFHAIDVKVKDRPSAVIRARTGYWALEP